MSATLAQIAPEPRHTPPLFLDFVTVARRLATTPAGLRFEAMFRSGDAVLLVRRGGAGAPVERAAETLGLVIHTLDTPDQLPFGLCDRMLGNDRHGRIKAIILCCDGARDELDADVSGLAAVRDRAFHDAPVVLATPDPSRAANTAADLAIAEDDDGSISVVAPVSAL